MKPIIALSFLFIGALAVPSADLYEAKITEFGIQNRIAGGDIASPNQFPYQVGLRILNVDDEDVYYTWCGGSLISDKVILTAAHCLHDAGSALIYLGAHDISALGERTREMIHVKKKQFIIHEDYDHDVIVNDIALILLPHKVKLNQYINTVKLPKVSQTDLVGRKAVASGWGLTGDKKSASDLLLFVRRTILDNSKCEKFFGGIPPSQLCMEGTDGKATCEGDSGGPLVIEESDGTKTIVGLTSFGAETCGTGYPVVFTRVSSFLDWIAKHTGIENK